ncbi:hypothetical protein COT72_02315 [archaeon CG10_big_fil_rev_8_21_14_0_10_43_11]|nr:MAG: hypothetical protein COT72_02315 [archaeon CG10_big_fil_rev_8_21_14_0_10_43_11]
MLVVGVSSLRVILVQFKYVMDMTLACAKPFNRIFCFVTLLIMKKIILLSIAVFSLYLLLLVAYAQDCTNGLVYSLGADDCVECISDVQCQSQEKVCEWFNSYSCVDCRVIEDCPTNKVSWTSTRFCSGTIVKERGYFQEPSACTLQNTCVYAQGAQATRYVTDCADQGTLCINGACGCPDEQVVCGGTCVDTGLANNDACSCDSQCESNVCYSGTCETPLNFSFTDNQTYAFVNETFTKSVWIQNLLDKPLSILLTLNTNPGVLVNESCSKTNCSVNLTLEPHTYEQYVLALKDEQQRTIALTAFATLLDGNQTHELEQAQTISLESCGDGVCSPIENGINCCSDCGCGRGFLCDNSTDRPNETTYYYTNACMNVCGDTLIVEGETPETCCIDAGCADTEGVVYEQCNTIQNACEKKVDYLLLVPFGFAGCVLVLGFFLRKKLKRALRFIIKNRKNIHPKRMREIQQLQREAQAKTRAEHVKRILDKQKERYSRGVMWFEDVHARSKGEK